MMSIIPPISTKRTITSHLKSLNIKQTITCRDGHPGPGLVQAQKCWEFFYRLMGSSMEIQQGQCKAWYTPSPKN